MERHYSVRADAGGRRICAVLHAARACDSCVNPATSERDFQAQLLNISAMQALGMAASNSGFVGYPVAAMVIGSPTAVLLALKMVIGLLTLVELLTF
ncbi:MAG: hypothetical protein ACTH5D_02705 [Halomonas sp.]|uniref:hypothetical protein n=1 Tax=Halomonas sp. TaxID=1486246 RepID=UPI003F8F9F45